MRRNNKTIRLGIAALGVLQYMGPRPLFVRTAYAAAPAAAVEPAAPIAAEAAGAAAGDLAPAASLPGAH
jgi:hypothetical protein